VVVEAEEDEGTRASSGILSFFLSLSLLYPIYLYPLPSKQVQVAAHEDERVELLRSEGDACFGNEWGKREREREKERGIGEQAPESVLAIDRRD